VGKGEYPQYLNRKGKRDSTNQEGRKRSKGRSKAVCINVQEVREKKSNSSTGKRRKEEKAFLVTKEGEGVGRRTKQKEGDNSSPVCLRREAGNHKWPPLRGRTEPYQNPAANGKYQIRPKAGRKEGIPS